LARINKSPEFPLEKGFARAASLCFAAATASKRTMPEKKDFVQRLRVNVVPVCLSCLSA
jgi:hypothetical protein